MIEGCLIPMIKSIKFFKKDSEEMTDQDLKFLTERLKLEAFNPFENVINKGEQGDKFYIMIQGAIDVYVPTKDGEQERRD